jgi:hypothetical protein
MVFYSSKISSSDAHIVNSDFDMYNTTNRGLKCNREIKHLLLSAKGCLYLSIRYIAIFKISLKIFCSSKLLQFIISFRCWSLGLCRTTYFLLASIISRIVILNTNELLVLEVIVTITVSSQKPRKLRPSDCGCTQVLCMTVISNITSIISFCLRFPI